MDFTPDYSPVLALPWRAIEQEAPTSKSVRFKWREHVTGCTLAELRYDEDVENRFAGEIEKYHKENNQELIVVLSIFDTDEKGGDGEFNPNDTYVNWQWYLVKTADKKSWEIINLGY